MAEMCDGLDVDDPIFSFGLPAAPISSSSDARGTGSSAPVSSVPLAGTRETIWDKFLDADACEACEGGGDGVTPSAAAAGRSDQRGSYDRSGGKGHRQSWATSALHHLTAIQYPLGSFFTEVYCSERSKLAALPSCSRTGGCIQNVCARDMHTCLTKTYGDPLLDDKGVPTAKAWPSIGNHAAGAVWFDLVCNSLVDGKFVFIIHGTTVCASFWRAAHNIPRTTFDELCRSASKGDSAWKPGVAAGKASVAAARGCEDKITATSVATSWWLRRLTCYDAMPNERGAIIADITTWVVTYREEYLPECEMLGLPFGGSSVWYAGRKCALRILAEKVYGTGAPPFMLRVRAKNRTFKECDTCQANRLAYKAALQVYADTWATFCITNNRPPLVSLVNAAI